MVEGANSKRDLANHTSSRGCCGRGYGSQSRRCSLRGCPNAATYDNLCSPSNSHPYSHRHAHAYAYAYAHAYPYANPDTYATATRTYADPDPDPHTYPYAHAYPYARLRRTIPKLGVAIHR